MLFFFISYNYNIGMINVGKIVKYMNLKYPKRLAEEWDKVGLIFGSKKSNITKIIVALDLTTDVLDVAVENHAGLIIVHHPFLFDLTNKGLAKEYEQAPYKKEIVERLENTQIAVFVAHTNFDKKGMTPALVEALQIKKTTSIPKRYPYGFIGEYVGDSDSIAQKIKMLGVRVSEYPYKKVDTKKIAFFPGGSGGDFVQYLNSRDAGADLMVISEIKHHIKVTAKEMKVPFLIVDHDIEKVMVPYIAKKINDKFKELVIAIPYKGGK